MSQAISAVSGPAFSRAGSPLVGVARRPAPGDRTQSLRLRWVIGLVILHAGLGVVFKKSGAVATVHALGTLGFGLYLAVRGRSSFPLACWGLYVVGAEVLWRMAGASLNWEFGKYAVSFVFLLRFFRQGPRNAPWAPVLYFVLLLPAIALTLMEAFSENGIEDTRKLLSFNLSGPLSLLACSLFFSRVHLTDLRMQRLMVWLLFPVVATAAAILFGLSALEHVGFGGGSNFLASGGFGPNQISGTLGLGVVYAMLLALEPRLRMDLRLIFLGLALWFAGHAALSFSRTGIYVAAGGLLAALPFLSIRRILSPVALIILGLALAGGFFTWNLLMRFTEGKIGERLANTGLTHRDTIAKQDLELWASHPVFGAGVGMSSIAHAEGAAGRIGAHTEYTRLVAEHGLLGAAAGILLVLMAARPLTAARSKFTKATILAGVVMTLLSLAASAMRTAAPGLLIGMAAAQFGPRRPRLSRIRGRAVRLAQEAKRVARKIENSDCAAPS